MRRFRNFSPLIFVVSIAVCAVVAGIVAWFTKIGFGWIFLVVVGAVLINALVAGVEDREASKNEDEPASKQ